MFLLHVFSTSIYVQKCVYKHVCTNSTTIVAQAIWEFFCIKIVVQKCLYELLGLEIHADLITTVWRGGAPPPAGEYPPTQWGSTL